MKAFLKRIIAVCCVVVMLVTMMCANFTASAANDPEWWRKPAKVTYVLERNDDGYARGEITVKVDAWVEPAYCQVDAVMFWADATGPLLGYSHLARFAITTVSTTFEFPELQIIPEGADRIRVYTAMSDSDTLSAEYEDAFLPTDAGYSLDGTLLNEFAVISDTHITGDINGGDANNLKTVLNDLKICMPNGEAIFINGDVINGDQSANGVATAQTQWQNLWTVKDSVNADIPMYFAIGNHDLWPSGFVGNTKDQMVSLFCENAGRFLPEGSKPTSLTYDFWIDDCHFIFLGDDDLNPNYAEINTAHLTWLDQKIAEGYDDEHKTFLFLHQSLSNTVAGGLTNYGQADHGIQNVPEVKAVLKKYPNAIMFNSHSHYPMNSVGNAYYVDDYPTSFNTSSVRHWSGVHESEGYVVRVYEDKVAVLGRDFTAGEWISSAQYVIPFTTLSSGGNTSTDNIGGDQQGSSSNNNGNNQETTTPPVTEQHITNIYECKCDGCQGSDTSSSTETTAVEEKKGCGSALGMSALFVALIPAAVCFARKKKED